MPDAEELTREQLEDRAREAGITGFSSMDKQELADAIAAKETAAAGPVVPQGETEPVAPKPSGKTVKGIQPQDEDDIPDAGR
jgi:hypothetical protein